MDKPFEHAASGVQHFRRVEHDDQAINVSRCQLDPMPHTCALVAWTKSNSSPTIPSDRSDLETLR